MKLLAAINGKLYALEEIDPNDVLDGCYRGTLEEVDDETALGGLGQFLPDCNLMKSMCREVDDWFVKSAARAEKECREKEDGDIPGAGDATPSPDGWIKVAGKIEKLSRSKGGYECWGVRSATTGHLVECYIDEKQKKFFHENESKCVVVKGGFFWGCYGSPSRMKVFDARLVDAADSEEWLKEVDRAWAIGSQEHKREILNLIEKQREAWGKAFAASDEEAVLLQTKEDCSRMLEWCKPGMRIQVCPSNAAHYFAEVIEGPNDLTGSILVKNELTGRKHPVLATANVYAAPDPDNKAYGVNLRKQSDQESESPHAHTT